MKKLNLDDYLKNFINSDGKIPESPSIFSNQSIPSLNIYNFLKNRINDDWWENEFETIETYLKNIFGIILIGPNREKVHALQRLCNSNLGFIDWYEFNILSISLNGGIVDFDSLVQPTPGMIISAVKIMNKVRPDQNDKFGDEVKKYITLVFLDNGIYTPPPSLVNLISKYMATLVTKERIDEWINIVKNSFKLMQNTSSISDNDDIETIQANRVAKAELSASVYSG